MGTEHGNTIVVLQALPNRNMALRYIIIMQIDLNWKDNQLSLIAKIVGNGQ